MKSEQEKDKIVRFKNLFNMKKLLFMVMAMLAISANARVVNVYLLNGKTIKGELLSYNESELAIEPNSLVKYKRTLHPSEVEFFEIEGVGKCNSINGKFVFDESTKIIPVEEVVAELQPRKVQPSSPNEVIGQALKTIGGTCIGIGVPSLIVGTILVVYGNTDIVALPKTMDEANKNVTKVKCSTAGCVLLPFGSALTIVGIPLHVHGKRIAELNVNYTGNGAGLAINF